MFCGGGVYSAIDLSLYLVEQYCGHEIAVQTAKALLLETPRTLAVGLAARRRRARPTTTRESRRRRSGCSSNFKQERADLTQLAARVGMSPRNFARRFRSATGETPLAYLHRLRIDAARHLLETRPRSIADVSRAVGYEDISFFRTLFKRHTGSPPRVYRARFGRDAPPEPGDVSSCRPRKRRRSTRVRLTERQGLRRSRLASSSDRRARRAR